MANLFNGSMKLKICEATDLRPTDFATRLNLGGTKNVQLIDPYIAIDVDDQPIAKTTTKPKTLKPVWNEDFCSTIHNGHRVGLTVFHDAAIPPDVFVANCFLTFEEVKGRHKDLWVRIYCTLNVHVYFVYMFSGIGPGVAEMWTVLRNHR